MKLECDETELREVFLNELTQLTLRHGFVISGCGCCNSPDVGKLEDKERANHAYVFDVPSVEGAHDTQLRWSPK